MVNVFGCAWILATFGFVQQKDQMKNNTSSSIKEIFKIHTIKQINKNIPRVIGISFLILVFFMFSDIYIRNVINAFYTRLLPFGIALIILLTHYLTKKHEVFLYRLVILFFTSTPVMLYALLFVYKDTSTFEETITATILLIFMLSIALQTNILETVLIMFLPFIIFLILFYLFTDVSKSETLEIVNIIPMLIIGFVVNGIHNKQKFKLFKASYLLEQEKKQTTELYKKTLSYNILLSQKNKEIITQNKRLIEKEQKLILNEARLKKSNKTKDKFFSIIAHDLRSPFNAMLGFSELLATGFDEYNTEQKKNFANIIHQGLQDTFKLLENLLYWSSSQRETIDFKPETINLYLLYEGVSNLLSQSAENKSIKLINQISEKLFIEADKEMLSTIIRNLISNAIKFTKKNGTVIIKSQLIKDDNNNEFTEIIVKDNGIGISKKNQSELFEIEENISTKGTENETGTGLGLILCKEFVKRHGGKIWIESEVDKGSSFCFTIPYNYIITKKNTGKNLTELETE